MESELASQEQKICEYIKDYSDGNSLSISSENCRESLGILPPDFNRESFGFSNSAFIEELKRESLDLGHLHLSRYEQESLICGKESLGLLQLSSLEAQYGPQKSKSPDILITVLNESANESVCDIFNKAFIYPSPTKYSTASSYSCISFNTNSFEEPSKIYSLPSSNENVFSNSLSDPICYTLGKQCFKLDIDNRLRVNSLPIMLKHQRGGEHGWFSNECIHEKNKGSVISLLNEGKLINSSEIDSQVGINSMMVIDVNEICDNKKAPVPLTDVNGVKSNDNNVDIFETHRLDKEDIGTAFVSEYLPMF